MICAQIIDMRSVFPLLILCFSVNILLAQDTGYLKKMPIAIKKLSGTIWLDGLSDEPVWKEATSFPFIVLDPVWGQAPTEKTELLLGYDNEYLYVAGRCYTRDSTTIVARNLIRDGWRGDDWMTLHIDSRFDKQNAFVFSVYPLGSHFDMATSNDAVEIGSATFNNAFNMIWDVKTVINKTGWFWEMKIPLYNLRFKPGSNDEIFMGISSTRAIQHLQEFHQFPAVPQNAVDPIMKPSLKQPVVLRQIPKQQLFLFTPYILSARSRMNVQDGSGYYKQSVETEFRPGFDSKIGVSSYLTLDVTANPDFSQVEADNQLVNLSRFSLFFPERRLFFQEQAGLFEFSLGGNAQLFYSRRIGINDNHLTDIYGGLRLTGKLNKTTDIGVLTMQTVPLQMNDSTRRTTENFSVLRLRKKTLNDRSFFGLMFTSRHGNKETNFSAGADGLISLYKNHYITFGASTTLAQNQLKKMHPTITASRVSLVWENRRTDHWFHKLGYTYSGNEFDPAMGFVDRTNYHFFSGAINYGKFAKSNKELFQYRRFKLIQADVYQNPETGDLETAELNSSFSLRTFKGTGWNLGYTFSYEYLVQPLDFGNGILIAPGIYRFSNIRLEFAPARFRKLYFPITISEGGFFDGKKFNLTLSPTMNINKHWELKAAYDFSYLRFIQKNITEPIHVLRMQINYAMNLRLSASLITQYNSTVNQVFNNLRIRYYFRDGHDLYFVWNESFNANRRYVNNMLQPRSDNQAIVVKYNYTFDKIRNKTRR